MSDLFGGSVLLDPAFHVAFTPDAALGEFADGLRKTARAGELVGALAGDAEHGRDLGCADEVHAESVTDSLDTVKPDVHTALDTVKGGPMTRQSLKRIAPGQYETRDGRYEVSYEEYWLEGECECAVCQDYIFGKCPNDGCGKRTGWHIWDRATNNYADFAPEPQMFEGFREARSHLLDALAAARSGEPS